MKRVKMLISGALVLAVVSSALAFSPKADNFCLYQKSGDTCPRISVIASFTTNATGGTEGLRPISNCPLSIPATECTRVITGEVVD